LVGSLNKIYEKEADIFAGSVTDKIAIISALKKIDSFYDGALNKWSYNYPTLNQRIENVENNH
jgi:Zn-dependent protease with chaperone function